MSETIHTLPLAPPLYGIELPAEDRVARASLADPSGRLVMRAGREAAANIGRALGLPFNIPVNRAAGSETCSVLRLGPDEWLVLADAEHDPWLSARISEAATDAAFSLVDVSHRNIGLIVEGSDVEAILSVGVVLPLDTVAFPIGKATRTLLGKAEVILWRRGERKFHLEVAASFAPYVVALLATAIANEAAIARVTRSSTPRP